MSRRRKNSSYRRAMKYFILFLAVLAAIFLIYVDRTLIGYENGSAESFMNTFIKDMSDAAKKGNMKKYIKYSKVESKYEKKPSLATGYKELFENNKATYKKVKENKYDIIIDKQKIATVTLNKGKTKHRLGLLTYNEYSIKDIKGYNEDGIYTLDFYLNNNNTLYINDIKVSKKDIKEETTLKAYEEVKTLKSTPKLKHYQIKGLTQMPEIKILDKKGKEVKYNKKSDGYYANNYYQTDDYKKAKKKLKNDFNPLDFAENWSKFLTADLNGPNNGFGTLEPNIMDGTAVYQKAYDWATSIDITFTSIHTIESITNKKMKNFTIYNDNAFSVEVYLEKNMVLNDNQKRQDILHEKYYFTYVDNNYKLVYMETITEK